MENKNLNSTTSEIFDIINSLNEEKNYIEILMGFCENSLETSDDMNKIYPIIQTIYNLHIKNFNKTKKLSIQ